jgi:hypothetical protein
LEEKSLISKSRSQSNEIALLLNSPWLMVDEDDEEEEDEDDDVDEGDELYLRE